MFTRCRSTSCGRSGTARSGSTRWRGDPRRRWRPPALMVRKWSCPPSPARSSPGKRRHGPRARRPPGRAQSTSSAPSPASGSTDTHVDLSSKRRLLQLAAGLWAGRDRARHRPQGRRRDRPSWSSRVDCFRPPYGRALVEVPRTCVVVGAPTRAPSSTTRPGRGASGVRVPGASRSSSSARGATSSGRRPARLSRPVSPGGRHRREKAARGDAEEHTVDDSGEQARGLGHAAGEELHRRRGPGGRLRAGVRGPDQGRRDAHGPRAYKPGERQGRRCARGARSRRRGFWWPPRPTGRRGRFRGATADDAGWSTGLLIGLFHALFPPRASGNRVEPEVGTRTQRCSHRSHLSRAKCGASSPYSAL